MVSGLDEIVIACSCIFKFESNNQLSFLTVDRISFKQLYKKSICRIYVKFEILSTLILYARPVTGFNHNFVAIISKKNPFFESLVKYKQFGRTEICHTISKMFY